MNALRNSVRLIGHLGDDPKLKRFENNNCVTNFSIATSENYIDKKGEKQEITTWHRLVIRGKQAEIAEKYLKKGSQVAVDGKLTNRSYEDKKGEKQYISEVVVNSFLMLDKKEK